jgi:hypothetical protein
MQRAEFSWSAAQGWQGLAEISFKADLVLFFSCRMLLGSMGIYETLRGRFPAAEVLGCSGGGQINSEGIIDQGVTGIAMSFSTTKIKLFTAAVGDSSYSFEVGRNLSANLAGEKLAGVLVLADGLDINGDEFLSGLSSRLPADIVIGGGMAADDDRFKKTIVSANGPAYPNMVAALGFYGDDIRLTSGHGDGWKPSGAEFEITSSHQNKLYDLNGKSALKIYENSLGDQAAQLPMSGLNFPLRVYDPQTRDVALVRTLLGIDRDVGMMTFAGSVPEGWMAQLMHAEPMDLINAAGEAAEGRNMDALASAQVSILVSCIGRRLILGDRSHEEIASIKNALGGSPAIAGFYSYGEFATPKGSKQATLFNQSMTVFSISEAIKVA